MTSKKPISLTLSAALLLSASLAAKPASADGRSGDDRPIHLYATAYTGPIGKVASAVLGKGELTINGRAALGGQPIWSGDLIQSRGFSGVSMSLDSIGQVSLSRGASVRLATRQVISDDVMRHYTLIAALIQGDLAIKLDRNASAYVQAAGASYSSSEGAAFLASVQGGRPSISVKSGSLRAEAQAAQHQYSIKPLGHGPNISVPVRSARQIQVQVLEDDKPVSGVAVLFVLDTTGSIPGRLGMGTLTNTNLSVVTNENGIAALNFVSGNDAGTVPIVTTIEGTRVSWSGMIEVKGKGMSKATGWTIAALLGAGAAAGIAFALTREKEGTLQAQPPQVKNP